jgi:hypothetical protein
VSLAAPPEWVNVKVGSFKFISLFFEPYNQVNNLPISLNPSPTLLAPPEAVSPSARLRREPDI